MCRGIVLGCSGAFVPFAGEGWLVPGGRRDCCDIPGWDLIISGREISGDPDPSPVRG